MVRRATVLVLVVAAMVTGLIASPTPAGAVLPPGCHRSDTFGPSIKAMQHVFACLNGGRKMPVVTHRDPPSPLSPTTDSTGPGGPSCSWADHYFDKWCYSRGIPYLICDQMFYNASITVYGHHCANPYYNSGETIMNLWQHVKNVVHNHVFRACTIGAIVGGGTKWAGTVVLKVVQQGAKVTGPVGIMVSSGVGCVGGIIKYYWKP